MSVRIKIDNSEISKLLEAMDMDDLRGVVEQNLYLVDNGVLLNELQGRIDQDAITSEEWDEFIQEGII